MSRPNRCFAKGLQYNEPGIRVTAYKNIYKKNLISLAIKNFSNNNNSKLTIASAISWRVEYGREGRRGRQDPRVLSNQLPEIGCVEAAHAREREQRPTTHLTCYHQETDFHLRHPPRCQLVVVCVIPAQNPSLPVSEIAQNEPKMLLMSDVD